MYAFLVRSSFSRFFKQFAKVARQVVTTSAVSMFVGACFTSLAVGKYIMARNGGYPLWSTAEIPAAAILLMMLSCYVVFLWAATDITVDALQEEGFSHKVEILGKGRQVVATYWSQAKWKMVMLVLSPMLFSAPAGAFVYPGFELEWWAVAVPAFTLGWTGWWFGWWRLFKAAQQFQAVEQTGLSVITGGREISRR